MYVILRLKQNDLHYFKQLVLNIFIGLKHLKYVSYLGVLNVNIIIQWMFFFFIFNFSGLINLNLVLVREAMFYAEYTTRVY